MTKIFSATSSFFRYMLIFCLCAVASGVPIANLAGSWSWNFDDCLSAISHGIDGVKRAKSDVEGFFQLCGVVSPQLELCSELLGEFFWLFRFELFPEASGLLGE